MKFFLPFWFSDHIYPSFDPWQTSWEPKSSSQKFFWQLNWPRIPADGILVSRMNIEKSRSRTQLFEKSGVRMALQIPPDLPIFGDCGAWGYIKERYPPYSPRETLEFYRKMKFTHACTIDHIIFPETFSERYERLEITLNNAREMMNLWSSDKQHFGFDLVGVVQGWDAESYFDSAKKILDLGFDFIALGGQSRAPSKFTEDILRKCYPLWENKPIRVHVFGLARKNLFNSFRKYGVSSFDNAYHRRAWLSLTNNYELGDTSYTAIRIPIAKTIEERTTEAKVFESLRQLDERRISVSSFLKSLEGYDPERAGTLSEEYERTLKEKPWLDCNCIICKSLGIHVAIFRSNERNMRRGFHNLWNFYQGLTASRARTPDEPLILEANPPPR